MVGEEDLDLVLVHCRALLDGAEDLDGAQGDWSASADEALGAWTGPHARTFAARASDNHAAAAVCSGLLREEADQWAWVWAETVNMLNQQRRENAVADMSSTRGLGEQFGDLFLGDESGDRVAEFESVAVPRAENRYAATGGLVSF